MYKLQAQVGSHYSLGSQLDTTAAPSSSRQICPSERLVPDMVSDQVKRNPRRIALVDDSMQVTYGELDNCTNRLATELQALGAGANTVVAVCMPRSVLTVIASLAVMKAGAAYLPLDPNYPRERLSFILADADVPFILSESMVAGRLPQGKWKIILLDHDDVTRGTSSAWDPSRVCPDHLAYVIYTSGSTGTPKGVEITHKSLSNLVRWHQKEFAVTTEDRVAQFLSFGFDAAVTELWPHLAAGASLHVTPEEFRSSPELLKDWLIAHAITICLVPTFFAERLIMLEWPPDTKLRLLLTGAEALHRYPPPGLPFALINNYGPTEATVVATSGRVASAEPGCEQRPSIGRPIDGAEVYIVDQSLNPVPRGEVGELCIGGAGVGRGYVNSPELTADKFVPNPFTHGSDARLYRTGDLARWLPDGQIEYVGRMDNQIKIRGYRVEPNEIIAGLETHPAIQASAVIEQRDSGENQRLVAYLVLNRAQAAPTASALRDHLRSRLPDYMIPAAFMVLPELPLTSNGKIDYKSLPILNARAILSNDNYLSPRTVLEGKLSALVSNLLGVSRVGVNDNFFLIGGHSLFGIRLIARIRDNFGIELPLRAVFESPTSALLAHEIERAMVTRIGATSEGRSAQRPRTNRL